MAKEKRLSLQTIIGLAEKVQKWDRHEDVFDGDGYVDDELLSVAYSGSFQKAEGTGGDSEGFIKITQNAPFLGLISLDYLGVYRLEIRGSGITCDSHEFFDYKGLLAGGIYRYAKQQYNKQQAKKAKENGPKSHSWLEAIRSLKL